MESMREFIAKRVSQQATNNFHDAFRIWAESNDYMNFSQFVIMGNYAVEHRKDEVHQIFCQLMSDENADIGHQQLYILDGDIASI
jgi:hypothetical protein